MNAITAPGGVAQRKRVTLVQFSGDGHDPSGDLDAMVERVREHRASDLVVFPEFALRRNADPSEALRRLTREGPAVVFGEIRERAGRLVNLATLADARGAGSYAKTHVHWTESFLPGSDFPVFESPLGPTGMLICYDAAFPEVARSLALGGAKAILNVSAIPDHFHLRHVHRRLVACSTYNQVYTFFVNRTGRGYLGGSAVVDPEGEVVAVADDRQESLTVDVDMSRVDAWREAEPTFAYRRPEVYGALAAPPSVSLVPTGVGTAEEARVDVAARLP